MFSCFKFVVFAS